MSQTVSRSLSGLTLRDLEYILAVARTGHFGRAAEQCAVTQPALSEQIRKVETLLECVLFERGRHGARLTQRGTTLLPLMETIVRNARALMAQARSAEETLQGSPALGIIPTLAPYYMPTLLRQLRCHTPDIALRLTENRTADLARQLLDYELDLVVAALPASESGITTAPLFFEPFRALVPLTHPLAQKIHLTPADLESADLILLDQGNCLRDQTLSLCSITQPSRTPDDALIATSVEMLRYMVEAGEGVAVMPALAVEGLGQTGGFSKALSFSDLTLGRTIALWWRKTDPRCTLFENLADVIRTASPDYKQHP
ncbi:hypothetical protein HK13_06145 [Acetobacter indonesiensis]|uniref:hydrogen peroxide-inducible genes activator n=1 Tax=Acetobacter indonesiensis TaxID=104101 RepID=UPI000A373835|nr:hydrogen peroxide-inducible genes activator [Acetobacter indonesiensis]OUI97256.1 hypothetical protein HK13_06145 [Acetobacter indonesiensis]